LPDKEALQRVLDAAAGLTRYEAEGASSLTLGRHKQVRADAVWELKCQTLKKAACSRSTGAARRLRTWASGRCLSADQPGIYTLNANAMTVKPARKVRRDRSNN
jgi:hypothetical protein